MSAPRVIKRAAKTPVVHQSKFDEATTFKVMGDLKFSNTCRRILHDNINASLKATLDVLKTDPTNKTLQKLMLKQMECFQRKKTVLQWEERNDEGKWFKNSHSEEIADNGEWSVQITKKGKARFVLSNTAIARIQAEFEETRDAVRNFTSWGEKDERAGSAGGHMMKEGDADDYDESALCLTGF
jgi:hypothetical protein